MDPYRDPFEFCPYNPLHRVPRSRLQQHIIKCQQTYPELSICPYNATHRYPKEKIKTHVANCPAREQFLLEEKPATTTALLSSPQPIPQKEYLSVDDPDYESWD